MNKRILIAAGGSGGHLYPAQALAGQLRAKEPSLEVLFAGGGLATSRYFERGSFAFEEIACGALSLKNPLRALKALSRMGLGAWQSFRLIRRFKPDVVVGFGSYHSFPVLAAAKLAQIPIVLHEANSMPGKVNRLISRYAKMTAIYFPDAAKWLKSPCVAVEMPLREGYESALKNPVSKAEARRYFQLPAHSSKEPGLTVLVFGGSQGAKALNALFSQAAVQHLLPAMANLQVIHFTGDRQRTAEIQQLYAQAGIAACVKDFEKRMDLAWQAADLVVSRAGASTIAEQIAFEVPGIMIPFPFASDNHQEHNAQFMQSQVRGGVFFKERETTPKNLAEAIIGLAKDQHTGLQAMRQGMRSYKQNRALEDFCEVVLTQVATEK